MGEGVVVGAVDSGGVVVVRDSRDGGEVLATYDTGSGVLSFEGSARQAEVVAAVAEWVVGNPGAPTPDDTPGGTVTAGVSGRVRNPQGW